MGPKFPKNSYNNLPCYNSVASDDLMQFDLPHPFQVIPWPSLRSSSSVKKWLSHNLHLRAGVQVLLPELAKKSSEAGSVALDQLFVPL